MHKSHFKSLKVSPIYFPEIPRGVFATRHPDRPNPIGITAVELVERKNNILKVKGIDMLDKTPVIDIKPYTLGDIKESVITGWLEKKAKDFTKDVVYYFKNLRKKNVLKVIERVRKRLRKKDIKKVALASKTENTTLLFAEKILSEFKNIKIYWVHRHSSICIKRKNIEKLKKLGVEIVHYVSCVSLTHPLKILGEGFKNAVEISIALADKGKMEPREYIISIGGSEKGVDTAVVIKTAFSKDIFSVHAQKMPEIREILCIPFKK